MIVGMAKSAALGGRTLQDSKGRNCDLPLRRNAFLELE